jgi:ubiquinone/menaquinone biosynthesis C-methylase UbiE
MYGRRSVVNISHSDDELTKVTEMQKREIYPHFRASLNGCERIVLDFGCGYGRFTGDLADMTHGTAMGVDPVKDLLKMAPPHEGVEYRWMGEGRVPASDNEVDIVWVCLVLGGLRGDALSTAIGELDRVLKQGGLLFIVENTSRKDAVPHWAFRRFEEYEALLPFVRLGHLHDYFDAGEQISVMAGRKPWG